MRHQQNGQPHFQLHVLSSVIFRNFMVFFEFVFRTLHLLLFIFSNQLILHIILVCHILCKAFPQRDLNSTSFKHFHSTTITFKLKNFFIYFFLYIVNEFWTLAHIWPSVFVNKVLYYLSCTHLFTYYLWMLLCKSGDIEQLPQKL